MISESDRAIAGERFRQRHNQPGGMMHGLVKMIVGVAAMATIGIPAGAAAASHTARGATGAKTRLAGTSYFAPTTAGGGVSISLSRDGRQVRRAVFAFRQMCTDGSTVYAWDPNAAIPVSATGTFKANYDSGPLTDPMVPGETTQLVTSISGAISKGGARIVGNARVTFTTTNAARTVRCDTGEVQFTATD